MASIQSYETKAGTRWLFKMYLGINPETGKPKKTTERGFLTEKEAYKAAGDLKYKLDNKLVKFGKAMIFNDLADEWLEYYKMQGNKDNSIRNRRSSINVLKKFFGYLQTRKIKKTDYQNMLDSLHKQEYKINTIRGIHTTGKMIFDFAMNFGMALENVTLGAKIPRTKLTVKEIEDRLSDAEIRGLFYEKDELATFLQGAKKWGEWQDITIFTLLVYSGMRPGELCALNKTSDLDFEHNRITISKTIYREGPISNITTTTPKTIESARVIDMDPAVMRMLKQHIEWYQAHHINNPHQKYTELGYLFTRTNSKNYRGYPFDVSNIDDKMERILKKMPDLKRLTPHKLRHTHTSLLAESQDAKIESIMARLGHKDDRTTRQIYLHVTKHLKEKLSKNFSDVMKEFHNLS
ncbi:site-specific integrase [Listeria booriae]|uniref:tyrosine-type recombinase/integrase n=2 Tax=Listeria booriae TaxID=1552123 RepID=UPI001623F52A|nr:tyrosine-type recombinase/integrase [Listeria booriae]MBC1887980.1 site-specific integrase [Listeria booriae]